MISEEHAAILSSRAIEATEALVDAEIRWRNGQISDELYRSFKEYYYVRMHLDMICAEAGVDFQVSQTDKHFKTFCLAQKNSKPDLPIEAVYFQDDIADGAVYVYVFDYKTFEPIGIVYRLRRDRGSEVGFALVSATNDSLSLTLEKAAIILSESTNAIDNLTYF